MTSEINHRLVEKTLGLWVLAPVVAFAWAYVLGAFL